MKLNPIPLLLLLSALMLVLVACGGDEQTTDSHVAPTKSPSADHLPSTNPALDMRFKDSITEYVKTSWGTWDKGETIGQCLIANADSITKEAKYAVLEHGIDEAFDELSGAHLQSLSTAWDLCESKAETSSASSEKTAATATTTASPSEKTAATAITPTSPSSAALASTPAPHPTPTLVSRPVSPSKTATDQTTAPEQFNGRECTTLSNPQPKFTHPVIDTDLIQGTMPPGLASTGMLKPHGYFFVKKEEGDSFSEGAWSGYPRSVPVYAPVRSWLRDVYAYTSGAYGKDAPEPPVEYMLMFEVSCEVYYKLDHIGPLPEVIESSGPFPIGKNTNINPPIEIQGGDLVSYWSGVNPGGNVDIGVYNTTIERTYANQMRYADGWHDAWLNEDCPFDYFPRELRDKYYSLFTDKDAGRLVGTRPCRSSSESDLLGTVQGAWFEPGTYGSVFSISTSMSGLVLATFQAHAETGASFAIKVPPGGITYIEPLALTGTYCYQTDAYYNSNIHPMYVNLHLVGPSDLEVEYGTGNCTTRTLVETLYLVR